MKGLARLLLLLTISGSAAAQLPAFMSGAWTVKSVDGSVSEEHWMEPSAGVMLGMSRSVDAHAKVSFEFLRIAPYASTIAYYAMPEGRAATIFPLKSITADKVVFENPSHDFPQRIIYWRTGAGLCARIEGTMNGKPDGEQWCWSRR